jgi:hypothetical protein
MRKISDATYRNLKSSFGSWSSWVVWNRAKVGDLSIFEPFGAMHPFFRANLVYVGLDASRSLAAPWFNFHDKRRGSRERDHMNRNQVAKAQKLCREFKARGE